MGTSHRAGQIATQAREAREAGAPFDLHAACEGDPELFEAVAKRLMLQRFLDAAYEGARKEAAASRAPAVEPGQRVGTYRVVSKLGQGGMGTVFLALAEEATDGLAVGSRVALKVLHPHLLGRSGYQDRFRREVKAGQRVQHPNVVPTLGAGTMSGTFGETIYLAMRYEEGRTLRDLLSSMGTVPDALVLEIAHQVATGLEAIHGAEIVHRDLKPENILLTDDQRVLIMDLGVARLLDDSLSLTRDGQFAGSILYAAPEQFRDEKAGPAADLYALGLTLYELASGRHPFAGRTMASVMQAHLGEAPLPLRTHAPHVSRFLEGVIHTLLAKSQAGRFASAAELRLVLEQGKASTWWTTRQREGAPGKGGGGPTIRVRRATALRGRDTAFQALWLAWQAARDGRGRVVQLLGEDGIGKTRLIDALAQATASKDAHVLYGSYAPGREHGGIANALRDHLGDRDLAQALAPHLRETPRLTPHLAAWIRGQAPPTTDAPLTADALRAALVRILHGLAAEHPVLLALDDVHQASTDGRALLTSLARSTEASPILLVVALREGAERAELADLARLAGFSSITLNRIADHDVEAVVSEALGDGALGERIGQLMAERAGGIPYFVVEMLRGLLDSGLIARNAKGDYEERVPIHTLAVPDALRGLLLGRLEQLTSEERFLVDLASIQGYRFDPRLIASACDSAPVAALRRFAAIERREGIVRSDEEGHRFDHRLLHEVVYDELARELRAEYHTRLAEARSRSAGPTPTGEAAYFLARHHLAGRRPLAARPVIESALDYLKGQCRFLDAAELASRALAQPGLLEDESRISVLLARASAPAGTEAATGKEAALAEAWALAQRTGDPSQLTRTGIALAQSLRSPPEARAARQRITPLLEEAVAAGDRRREAEVAYALGACASSEDTIDRAWDYFTRSRILACDLGDEAMELRCLIALGRIEMRRNQLDEANRTLERALHLAAATKDRLAESSARLQLGIVRHRMGRSVEATTQLERCLEIAQEMRHRGRESEALGSLGNVASRMGDYAAAREFHLRDLAITREIGDADGEMGATINLANVAAALGSRAEARTLYERSLELARGHENTRAEAVSLTNLAMVAYDAGHYAKAQEYYEAGIGLARQVQDVLVEGQHLLNLAFLLGEMGAWQEADRLLDESERILGDSAWQRLRAYARYGRAQLHEWRGEEAAADACLREAVHLQRENQDDAGLAASLEWTARRSMAEGESLLGATILEEAWALARDLHAPDVSTLIATDRVMLAREHAASARRTLAEYEDRARVSTRIRARYGLWKATGNETDLAAARHLVEHLSTHAPAALREGLRRRNPLYRAVLEAAGR